MFILISGWIHGEGRLDIATIYSISQMGQVVHYVI